MGGKSYKVGGCLSCTTTSPPIPRQYGGVTSCHQYWDTAPEAQETGTAKPTRNRGTLIKRLPQETDSRCFTTSRRQLTSKHPPPFTGQLPAAVNQRLTDVR